MWFLHRCKIHRDRNSVYTCFLFSLRIQQVYIGYLLCICHFIPRTCAHNSLWSIIGLLLVFYCLTNKKLGKEASPRCITISLLSFPGVNFSSPNFFLVLHFIYWCTSMSHSLHDKPQEERELGIQICSLTVSGSL